MFSPFLISPSGSDFLVLLIEHLKVNIKLLLPPPDFAAAWAGRLGGGSKVGGGGSIPGGEGNIGGGGNIPGGGGRVGGGGNIPGGGGNVGGGGNIPGGADKVGGGGKFGPLFENWDWLALENEVLDEERELDVWLSFLLEFEKGSVAIFFFLTLSKSANWFMKSIYVLRS